VTSDTEPVIELPAWRGDSDDHNNKPSRRRNTRGDDQQPVRRTRRPAGVDVGCCANAASFPWPRQWPLAHACNGQILPVSSPPLTRAARRRATLAKSYLVAQQWRVSLHRVAREAQTNAGEQHSPRRDNQSRVPIRRRRLSKIEGPYAASKE